MLQRVGRIGKVNLFALQIDIAAQALFHGRQGAHHFAASRADQTGKAEDLALVQGEINILEVLAVAEILHAQQLFVSVKVTDVVDIRGGAADHHLDQRILRHVLNGHRIDVGAVLQDGHAVADLHDLFETMADIDDADALALQLSDEAEEHIDLFILEQSRRLVENDKTDILVHGDLADRDHRLHGNGELADLRQRVNAHFKFIDDLLAVPSHLLPVDEAELRLGLTAEEVVLRDAEIRSDIDMLVVCKDAVCLRIDCGGIDDPLTIIIHGDLALIGLLDTHDALDQGGFACAVLTDQRTHLAFLQGEAHVFQCRNTGVELADVLNS